MIIKGSVWKFGDNIDTDVIIPARYLNTSDARELAAHCMEDYDQNFVKKMKPGDVIVAGENFGCGSSREHAPLAIKTAGISCVIAKSFARIFYRNAINIGLPIFESAEVVDKSEEGDNLEITPQYGIIRNNSKNIEFKINSMPEFIQEIISAGGLVKYTRIEMKRRKQG
ncbi:MAG: 3-isopropylmalate dehydratase small subunit [Atribacterota bacterium]|jgi:3-isopropylmalate/(R)-2-methylmalate dehydratase small subunit|nr:3-isopropylmalate dehydratase small subunit [Atribacterota bacterium]MDD3032009.1 3-isopropylmalate dehydratase small subunit [Atribacterota bacterium]MDD4288580.1 3-isopropylmalate dehydratase small subunit [Atribacterota bacterium]MDD4765490.1 3-isopropylmalate dehydratase small subunit [Atribacterota bacterium]MDI9596891.1 3-isopropylmalate dehydratase small subunit [Atribacterota bacterium]